MKKKLRRNVQCKKCPWKKSTDPNKIPNGYSCEAHAKLKETIADPGAISLIEMRAMACHESPVGKETFCLGWLMNQLGPGNNLGLRMRMMDYDLRKVRLVGEQHRHFEDTLPK